MHLVKAVSHHAEPQGRYCDFHWIPSTLVIKLRNTNNCAAVDGVDKVEVTDTGTETVGSEEKAWGRTRQRREIAGAGHMLPTVKLCCGYGTVWLVWFGSVGSASV
jgi:hypothetical protein